MTHYRMLDRVPSVVITSNRNELKLYQGNVVYLNDGDNFELRFFNPLQEKIGVEIMFNGIKKGDSYLVLNPGQDIILDRFLDEQRKMLFETYVVNGNSKEVLEAIQQNGVISFNFYKELRNYRSANYNDININYNFPPKPIKYKKSKGHFGNLRGVYGSQGPQGPQGPQGSQGPQGYAGASSTSGTMGYSSNITYTDTTSIYYHSTLTNTAGMGSLTTSCMSTRSPQELETGRIEMGDISNQQLRTVNAQFQSASFHTVTYKIMPYSAMNKSIGEVRQYCSCCGYRIRKENWVYCPKCGSEL